MSVRLGCCIKCGEFWALTKGTCSCGGTLIDSGFDYALYSTIPELLEYWGKEDSVRNHIKETSNDLDKELFNNIIVRDQKSREDRMMKMAEQYTTTIPKCPTCSSTNLRKITTGNKVGSVLFWGIFAAGKVAKTWHCNNCGSEW